MVWSRSIHFISGKALYSSQPAGLSGCAPSALDPSNGDDRSPVRVRMEYRVVHQVRTLGWVGPDLGSSAILLGQEVGNYPTAGQTPQI